MVAESTARPLAPRPRSTTRDYRHPTWWTVRILDASRYEVTLFHQSCPLNWHVVTVAPDGAVACTCRSGREGFKRARRGWCDHVEALMRAALRDYRPITLTPERLDWCPPCHGCRPRCRSLIVHWSAAL